MTTRRSRRLGRLIFSAGLAGVLAFAVPASSWGYWSATASPAAVGLAAATVPAPGSLACATRTVVPLVGPQYVHLTWPATASSYEISIRNADGSVSQVVATTTNASYDIYAGLLNGLVSGLLTLLTSGGTAHVEVRSVDPSGWRSLPTAARQIKSASLLGGGLLGGVQCA